MKETIKKHEKKFQRFLEMLPGLLAWAIILFPVWGALTVPRMVAYFTIGFLVFWFYRSFQAALLGLKGYFKIRRNEKVNWFKKYQAEKTKDSLPWQNIKHLVIIPNVNESVAKLTSTLEALAKQKGISPKKLFVVLAMEERAVASRQRAKVLQKKFQHCFGQLLTTFHPDHLPGEIRGKAANEAWAAKEAKKILVDQKGLKINYLTVTSADADACFHPSYFAYLTYAFALNPDRYLRFWQSPIFWHNNYWRIPAFTRIVGTLGNIIHIAHLQEPDSLFFNYSTYSLSLKLLVEVGYWHTNIIPEDWHLFLQSFFEKGGQIEVEPIFLPTSIDAPEGNRYFASLKSRYLQCQRHAWGATDIPYAINQACQHPEIPLSTRFFRIYKLLETHLIWSTNWFILTLGAWLPALVNPVFKQTTLGYNLPKISRIILTTCLLSLLTMILLDRKLRPQKANLPRRFVLIETAQWVLMPIATLLMSVLPGLHSQTKLMLGKRLEYYVTEKV